MTYWRMILKWGLGAFSILILFCFIYGLFNRFSFMHGAAPAGVDSGLAYAFFIGIILGPFVFLLGAIIGVVKVKRFKRQLVD